MRWTFVSSELNYKLSDDIKHLGETPLALNQ